MAAGLPLVVTRTPGTRELVVENVNGLLFDWADVAALTAHLKFLAARRDVARQMGNAARARAQQFAWEDVADAYVELFQTMASAGKLNGARARMANLSGV
jgi:glycosyltransferase involved in cell wall biosynthesis